MDTITIIDDTFPLLNKLTWDIINFSIIGIALIAIIVVIMAKDKITTKVFNFLLVVFLPPLGSLFVFGRLLFRYIKNKNISSLTTSLNK